MPEPTAPAADAAEGGAAARLDALEAELRSLRAELAELRAAPPTPPRAPSASLTPLAEAAPLGPERPASTSRRLLLGGAAAGAAAAVVGALTGAEQAAATTGTMTYGTAMNSGADPTTLLSTSSTYVFRTQNTTGGDGLSAISNGGGAGVIASTISGIGVDASAQGGVGVRGQSVSGTAISALAFTSVGVRSLSNRTQLALEVSGTRSAPTDDAFAHSIGDVVRDTAGDLWLCVGNGTPGSWRKITGPAVAGALHVLPAPVRIYDSRAFSEPAVGSKTPLNGGEIRTLACTVNGTGVPTDARAVVLTCLIVNAVAGNGNFTVWAGASAKPSANTMVWGGSTGRHGSLALSALGPNATIQVSSSIKTDLVVDVVGYYR